MRSSRLVRFFGGAAAALLVSNASLAGDGHDKEGPRWGGGGKEGWGGGPPKHPPGGWKGEGDRPGPDKPWAGPEGKEFRDSILAKFDALPPDQKEARLAELKQGVDSLLQQATELGMKGNWAEAQKRRMEARFKRRILDDLTARVAGRPPEGEHPPEGGEPPPREGAPLPPPGGDLPKDPAQAMPRMREEIQRLRGEVSSLREELASVRAGLDELRDLLRSVAEGPEPTPPPKAKPPEGSPEGPPKGKEGEGEAHHHDHPDHPEGRRDLPVLPPDAFPEGHGP